MGYYALLSGMLDVNFGELRKETVRKGVLRE
jgi:hypothetical protein